MKLKKLKKELTTNDKFYIKHVFYDKIYIDCKTHVTSNIKDALTFLSYNEANNYRKALLCAELYEVIVKHEN